jgi:hypothetical protein
LSKVGGFVAFAAEAGIWVAGAALIASAVGYHWETPSIDVGGLIGATPSPNPALSTLAPGGSGAPTPSATAGVSATDKFYALTSKADFQYEATFTQTTVDFDGTTVWRTPTTGTAAANGPDCTDKRTSGSTKTTTYEEFLVGSFKYDRQDAGKWKKAARNPEEPCLVTRELKPRRYTDTGLEIKNALHLHRLELMDPEGLASEVRKASPDGVSNISVTLVVWVKDDGTPVAMQESQSADVIRQGKKYRVSTSVDVTFTKLSGVTITPPKV